MYSTSFFSVLFLAVFGLQFDSFSQVRFENLSVEKALEKGSKDNKMIYVYFSSNVCPGCKTMESQVFSNINLGDQINNNFISIRSNASTNEGRMEQYLYGIKMYPTQIFFNQKGEEVYRLEGKKSLDVVLNTVRDVLSGVYVKPENKNEEEKNVIINKGEIIKTKDEI